MLALTLHQPFAHFILTGDKRTENRGWHTAHRGLLLVHAGLTVRPDARLPGGLTPPPDLPRGVLLGVVELVDCVEFDAAAFADDAWAFGPWCWHLTDPRPFAVPVACSGRQGLWLPPATAALRRELRAVGVAG